MESGKRLAEAVRTMPEFNGSYPSDGVIDLTALDDGKLYKPRIDEKMELSEYVLWRRRRSFRIQTKD